MMNILRNTAINLNHRNNEHISHARQNRDGERGAGPLHPPVLQPGRALGLPRPRQAQPPVRIAGGVSPLDAK
jgi:hypothetical protein